MAWFSALVGLLKVGLEIWKLEKSREYIDKLAELERLEWEESNKPPGQFSATRLDNIGRELILLSKQVEQDLRLQS